MVEGGKKREHAQAGKIQNALGSKAGITNIYLVRRNLSKTGMRRETANNIVDQHSFPSTRNGKACVGSQCI